MEQGTRLGPYEILSPIGAGGMGEVHRARDTRLDREVAIKVLPARFSRSQEFRLRIEREAKVISGLTHPNICTLHDVGEHDGSHYLVMELLDGETLTQRIAKGPLPMEQVVRIGVEVAAALDKAHRAGIVHRDLKPGNIFLTKSGAKLLDFGLAKTAADALGPSGEPTDVTRTEPLTGAGTILGTMQYMAPEQLEGRDADARTDLFAFGAVLYEMATGRRAFGGSSRASLIASIMSNNPEPISQIQPMSPPALEYVVRTCLAKDPDDRIQTAHDLKLQLQWMLDSGSQVGVPAPVAAKRRVSEQTLSLATAVLIMAVVALGVAFYRRASSAPEMVTAAIPPPDGARFVFTSDAGGPAVISPNGKTIAFTGRCKDGVNRLWVRRLKDAEARVLPGTEDGYLPFWSPDSESIGFFARKQLHRISVAGGRPVTLCSADQGKGGTWTRDGHILFSPDYNKPLAKVSDSGGTPKPVTKLKDGVYTTHRWPVALPDGDHFLYFAGNSDLSRRGNDGIFFASWDGTVDKMVIKTRGNAAFACGHLLYLQNDTLMAQRFDATRGELIGDRTPIAFNVQYDSTVWRGVFSASDDGVLVYQTGLPRTGTVLTWFDPAGEELGVLGEQAVYDNQLRISPDGNSVVIGVGDPTDAWRFDLTRNIGTRLTTDPVDERTMLWSADGTEIAYVSRNRPDKRHILYKTSATGTGTPQLLFEYDVDFFLKDWSRDGRSFLVSIEYSGPQLDLALLRLDGAPDMIPLLDSPYNEDLARFSTDERWIAYSSDESGREEVYVIPFSNELTPKGDLAPCDRSGRWQISTAGGTRPIWAQDGKKLYYQALDGTLFEVQVDTSGDELLVQAPQRLFMPTPKATDNPGRDETGYAYDVTPDSKRFLVQTLGSGDATPLTIILNWPEMVSDR